MKFPRASGILLHPTSLPGEFGIGDLGPGAYRFLDILAEAGQTYWQILPLGPTGFGDSPYQCFSAFAGNSLLISPEKLVDDGLLNSDVINRRPAFPSGQVDFGSVYHWKQEILAAAFDNFKGGAGDDPRGGFEKYCQKNGSWLDDYALFRAIKASQGQKPWNKWPESLKRREESAIATEAERLDNEIEAEKFYQFIFSRQWAAVKEYANDLGVKIVGDIPIFVAFNSSDVWCDQDQFKLNADGSAKAVAGVPPDYYSKTGQLWGNPIYDWEAMQSDGFHWWIDRFRYTLETVDVARVDHFRGFSAVWEVPGTDKTAENGQWVEVPGAKLFEALVEALGDLAIFAEDLGDITPDVQRLRDGFGFTGMRILQFAFGGDAKNLDLPHNYTRNCVAYTGTHDNDTTIGWFKAKAGAGSTRGETEVDRDRAYCLKYLDSDGSEINWDFLRAVWASTADTAIAPLQDLLGYGSEGRMNLPGSTAGNWKWRYEENDLTDEVIERLREMSEIYGRVRA